MMIAGRISGKNEAIMVQQIAKNFVVGNRARLLARQIKN